MPPEFTSGLGSTGEDTEALWKVADPSNTGSSMVPLTYLFRAYVIETQTKRNHIIYTHDEIWSVVTLSKMSAFP